MPRKKVVKEETVEAPAKRTTSSRKSRRIKREEQKTTDNDIVVTENLSKEKSAVDGPTAKRSVKRKRETVNYADEQSNSEESSSPKKPRTPSRLKAKRVNTTKLEEEEDRQEEQKEADGDAQTTAKPKTKTPRKRKTAEEKAAEMAPLAARSTTSLYRIGAHVSAAGGVQTTVGNAVQIGANAFACFLKSQRKWENPPLKDEHRDAFKSLCGTEDYDAMKHIVPHGSYLVNLANPNAEARSKAYAGFLDDLQRCDELGIGLYNFHPGNTNGEPRDEALARLAVEVNKAHKQTKTVVTLLENMAADAEGKTIGGSFEDLHTVIEQIEDQSRVGVCLDTCHAFAAGYDLRSPQAFKATMAKFDDVVGMCYLRAVHLNDSKAPFGSHRDLHQNIGLGFLGLSAFHNLMNEERLRGIPMVLETPIDKKNEFGKSIEDKKIWAEEIKLLESLVGIDAEGEEFKRMETELAKRGEAERAKLQEVVQRKAAEREKKAAKTGKKGKTGNKEDVGDESE